MKISIYSTAWNVIKHSFDYKGALDNWAYYADEISIAIGISEDDTYNVIESYAKEKGYPVSLVKTEFDFTSDSFAYGKTENAALQNCTGDILIQQNLDERLGGNKDLIKQLGEHLYRTPFIDAYYVPVINLYGSYKSYLDIAGKWYVHKKGFFRGAVKFGIKEDGKPDYNKTSTDELIDAEGNLVRTMPLINEGTIEVLKGYASTGMPLVYHLGYVDFKERLDRSVWWKQYWEKATGGDTNKHPTSVEEIANRETKEHGIALWPKKETESKGSPYEDGSEYFHGVHESQR